MAPKRKKHEEFVKEVYDLVGDEYTVLSKYTTSNTKVQMRHNCDKCDNYEYPVAPNKFLHGTRCPACSELSKIGRSNKKKEHEEFVKEVYDLVGDEYTVLSKYINSCTDIQMRHNCDKCDNYEYPVKPSNFISHNDRCPKCSGNKKKDHDEFVKEVYDLMGNEYTVLGKYENNKKDIQMRHNCDKCDNYEYPVRPNDFLMGSRCPKCSRIDNIIIHKGSEKIKEFLLKNNIKFTEEKKFENCKNIRKLPFDFYISDLGFLIEFDGEQHFFRTWWDDEKKLKEQQKRDRIKDKYCIDNNITILRIAYNEINNLEDILDKYFNNQQFDADTNIFLYKEGNSLIQGIYKEIIEEKKED